MSSVDFTIFYKKKYEPQDFFNSASYDTFISVFNDSERVRKVFEEVNAINKYWLIFPEYRYSEDELPSNGNVLFFNNSNEDEIIDYLFDNIIAVSEGDICIDITGFIRPHLVYLIRFLSLNYASNIDFLYSDPVRYKKKEDTDFSHDYVAVKQITGCEGSHNPETSNDILIIGAGYDNARIRDVAKEKSNARKVQIFGFPPLQPDMYQENIIKAYKAEEASSSGRPAFIDPDYSLFAPANDPFITADTLQSFIIKENNKKPITNLYLSPLSTKAQVLGFALYYASYEEGKAVSVLFPYCNSYSRETTEGLSRVWVYTVEFDSLK